MPDPKKEVRASQAMARVRRLAALPEPKRTSALLAHAKRIRRPTLVALVNGLNVDRFSPPQPEHPFEPRGPTPDWVLELPLEFLAIMCRRLWPVQFHVASTKPAPAKTGTIGDRIKLLWSRQLKGTSLWNGDDVSGFQPDEDSERHGPHREQRNREGSWPANESDTVRQAITHNVAPLDPDEDANFPLASWDKSRWPNEETDQQLVHEWMCMYVYGKADSRSMREIIAAAIAEKR